MSTTVAHPRHVLADAIPGGITRDITLTLSAALFVGLAAQVAIPLPFTPVPLSLATFAVLLSGAALGPARAGLGMLFYLSAGVAGMPWFSQQNSGWNFPSFGYIIGFVLAATLVGWLARRGGDRTVLRTAGLMVIGNLMIYGAGVPWLMSSIDVTFAQALPLGVTPFLVGDAIKIVLAAGLLPAAWRLRGAD